MKTAEEYIDEDNDLDMPSDGCQTTYTREDVVKLINLSRKEAIEEAAFRTPELYRPYVLDLIKYLK